MLSIRKKMKAEPCQGELRRQRLSNVLFVHAYAQGLVLGKKAKVVGRFNTSGRFEILPIIFLI